MENSRYAPEEPIAAIATALSPAALAIVRASGRGCVELVAKIFSRPKALLCAQGNSIVYGWLLDGGKKIDEVLVSVFRAPKSFTGEEMAEISCHGGPSVVRAVYALLLKSGFRPAERGEFTFRAYINGKADLTKAEAVREIIDSKTDAARGRAAGRLDGGLFAEIGGIKKLLINTLASIEVEIEYPEDEEAIADSFDKSGLLRAERELHSLENSWAAEKLYQDGARVVLCGRTNAGKSSLFNALLKEDRAIVSDIEGTTRDWLESLVSFAGIPARLFDTAGLRQTEDSIEKRGVERAKDLAGEADLILYLVDSKSGLLPEDTQFIQKAAGSIPLVLVWNKCDLAAPQKIEQNLAGQVEISAKSGEGIGTLCQKVKEILCAGNSTEREQPGLGSLRQKNAVSEALASVRHALAADEYGYSLDAVVQDLEDALDALGRVSGEVAADDILDAVFGNFCVGK